MRLKFVLSPVLPALYLLLGLAGSYGLHHLGCQKDNVALFLLGTIVLVPTICFSLLFLLGQCASCLFLIPEQTRPPFLG